MSYLAIGVPVELRGMKKQKIQKTRKSLIFWSIDRSTILTASVRSTAKAFRKIERKRSVGNLKALDRTDAERTTHGLYFRAEERHLKKKYLTTLIRLILLVILLLANSGEATSALAQVPASRNQAGALTEEFSFLINDLKVHHQGEDNTLNLTILLRYKANITKAEYPDFRWIAKDIETLLKNYPNADDYWELVNKRLTSLVLEKYPPVAKVTITIQVSPSSGVPYTRSSKVTRERMPPRRRMK